MLTSLRRHHRAYARAALAWALLLAALPACNSDDDVFPDVHVGVQPSGGAGNLPGRDGHIGERCSGDADCATGFCLRADDPEAVLTSGTAPGGLCTVPCDLSSQCRALDERTTCVDFGTEGYCVQTCRFGDPRTGDAKCSLRAELSCQPLLVPDAPACDEASPCPEPSICWEGTCSILPACLPRCNGDFDCPDDRFCDPRYGECVAEPPGGKLPGDTCDRDGPSDECRGRCLQLSEEVAECDENCTLGAPGGCGYPDARTAPVVCGFIAYDFGVPQGDLDEGACAHVCRCNEECPGEQRCLAISEGIDGLCVGGLALEDSIEACPPD